MSEIKLNTIEEAIEDFREGKLLIVVDDEDRENEGDFIIAAEKITPEKVNFMLKNGRGVLCAPITEERCQELELDMQVANNTSLLGTPFTITVDKLGGNCTTGVSMFDRAETILALADPKTKPSDLAVRDISIRFAPVRVVSCAVPDIPKLLSTWHASPVCTRQVH